MRIAGWLERGAFFVLLLLIGMRPLLSETYESAEGIFAEYVRAVNIATSATTAGFDVAIWLAAVAVTVVGVWRFLSGRGTAWRWTGLEIGFVCMAVAAAVSIIVAASNRRLALNASVDWLSGLALAMLIANLCRDRLRLALVLAVVAAAGAASGVRSVMQVTTEFRETREDYERNKDTLWGAVPPDDPRRQLYERRMNANEATGFLAHSNAQGSLLLLCGFGTLAAGGWARAGWTRWALYAGGVVQLALIALTGSRGAMLAAGCGLGLLLMLYAGRTMLRRHWRAALAVGWVLVVLGGAGVMLLGQVRGGLPGSSLEFRWNYWQVTAAIVGEHPWTGVGALNYDRAYLCHKPIEFPEEIRDPHNFVLSILAQWGVLGLLGLVLSLVGGSIMAVRAWAQPPADSAPGLEPTEKPQPELTRWLLAVVGGYVLLRLWLMRGLMSVPGGQAQIFVDVVQYGITWAATFLAVVVAATRGDEQGGAVARLAVLCGIGAFLLHNTIDFPLFVPGTLTVFAAMVGIALAQTSGFSAQGSGEKQETPIARPGQGARPESSRGRSVAMAIAPVALATLGLGLVLFFVYVPVSRASAWLEQARARRGNAKSYLAAASADPLDPTPLVELTERQLRGRDDAPHAEGLDLDVALARLDKAVERDPRQISLYRMRAGLCILRYGVSNSERDLRDAITAARHALQLYPSSPDEHLGLARVLAHAAVATGSREWADQAREEYAKALALDAARPGTDEVRKWSPRRRADVEAAIVALDQVMDARATENAAQTQPSG